MYQYSTVGSDTPKVHSKVDRESLFAVVAVLVKDGVQQQAEELQEACSWWPQVMLQVCRWPEFVYPALPKPGAAGADKDGTGYFLVALPDSIDCITVLRTSEQKIEELDKLSKTLPKVQSWQPCARLISVIRYHQ